MKFLTCGSTSDRFWCVCVCLQCPSLYLFQFVGLKQPRASRWLKCLMSNYPKKVPPSWHTALRFLHSAAIHGMFTRVGLRVVWGLAGWWSETVEERGYSMHSNAPCNVTCVANKSGRRSRTAVVGTPLSPLNPNVLGRWGGTGETDQCEHKLPPVLRCTTLHSLALASDNQGHPDTCSHMG